MFWYVSISVLVLVIVGFVVYFFFNKYRNSSRNGDKRNYDQQCDAAFDKWKQEHQNDFKLVEGSIQNTSVIREYKVKQSLITACEKQYYTAIRNALSSEYILQPQVNLASIIEKESAERYQNELYRNIDFCVFNQDFCPVLLIEINDKTHETDKSRQARDIKVKEICKSAEIPLVTFWTKYGVNQEYIQKRLSEFIQV